ncbi:hypothetical protein J6590_019606 [Homalodisca vitripennis]|nr:hypothetical protein J6590_019606 [Homalodisca vitripennis]
MFRNAILSRTLASSSVPVKCVLLDHRGPRKRCMDTCNLVLSFWPTIKFLKEEPPWTSNLYLKNPNLTLPTELLFDSSAEEIKSVTNLVVVDQSSPEQ